MLSVRNKREPFTKLHSEVSDITFKAKDSWKHCVSKDGCFSEWALTICNLVSSKMHDF